MNWLTISFLGLAIGACIYFDRLDKAQQKHDAMVEREEAQIRDDARAMTAWYRERNERKDSEVVEAFLAEL